ncbi:hypothetical protein AB0B66_20645 [Catellatospora sp. NPDC049111]|uniref:hypothetical protein n=1 Tax=Catellatospora sp. NPDC049111 TaxID=3155271 RepID=UPI0033DAB35C
MELIVVPRLLAELLGRLDDRQRSELAFAYAEHVLGVCGEALSETERAAASKYLGAAHDLLTRGGSIERLAEAHHVFFATRGDGSSQADRVMWIAKLAVDATCQRALEEHGVRARQHYQPGVLDVAREGRQLVAAWTARSADSGDAAGLRRTASWEEARWQLIRLLAAIPVPDATAAGHDRE